MISTEKTLAFLRSRLALLLIGITSEILYLFYLLRQFPLLRFYQDLTDMGIINGYSHSGFLLFALLFSILFALFGLAWREARQLHDRATLWLILAFGGIFALTTIFVYPITAIDVFNYIAESLVLVDHHANPLVVSLTQYPHDPLVRLTVGWGIYPASYGPLGILVDALPTLLADRNVLVTLLLMKSIFSLSILVSSWIVYKILLRLAPDFALAGALALAWNPYVLLEFSANSHNDMLMVFFILLALWALVEKRPLLAFALITASALTKYASLPLLPLFFIYSVIHQPTFTQKMRYIALAPLTSSLVAIVLFSPFWAGMHTFDSLSFVNRINLSSFNMFLNDLSAMHISVEQAKIYGEVVFGLCYLAALFLSTRTQTAMIYGCFIAMFSLLAFGVSNVEVWYAIWAFGLAVVVPRNEVFLAAFLFIYGATLSELIHAYVWFWVHIQTNNDAYVIVNSIGYLGIFLPALFVLLSLHYRQSFTRLRTFQQERTEK